MCVGVRRCCSCWRLVCLQVDCRACLVVCVCVVVCVCLLAGLLACVVVGWCLLLFIVVCVSLFLSVVVDVVVDWCWLSVDCVG